MDLFVSILHLVTVTCICFGLVMLSRAVRSLAKASVRHSNALRLLGDAQSALEHRVLALEKSFGCPPVESLLDGQQVLADDPPGDIPWG